MTPEEEKIAILYRLLEQVEREHDLDTAAALRWAIFTVERTHNITI